MAKFSGMTFSDGTVEFTIHEHIAVLDRYEGREVPWTREINIVSWNGGQPKIDIRDWSSDHRRMSRGISNNDRGTGYENGCSSCRKIPGTSEAGKDESAKRLS